MKILHIKKVFTKERERVSEREKQKEGNLCALVLNEEIKFYYYDFKTRSITYIYNKPLLFVVCFSMKNYRTIGLLRSQ